MSRSLVKTLGFYGPFAWAAPTFVFGVLPVAMALKRLHPGAEPLLWRVAQRYYRFFLANLERLGAIALDVRHAERAHVSRPAVYVANHRTLIDVLLLLSQVPRATCQLKSTAIAGASPDESGLPRGRMPAYWSAYITAAVRGLGYVPMPGDWTDHHALLRVLRECQAGLEAGRPLIIFR